MQSFYTHVEHSLTRTIYIRFLWTLSTMFTYLLTGGPGGGDPFDTFLTVQEVWKTLFKGLEMKVLECWKHLFKALKVFEFWRKTNFSRPWKFLNFFSFQSSLEPEVDNLYRLYRYIYICVVFKFFCSQYWCQKRQVVTMNPHRCKACTQVNMFQVTQAAWEASSCPSHRCTRRNRDQKIWVASPSSSRQPCATQVVPTSAKNTGEINELRCVRLLPDSNVLSP